MTVHIIFSFRSASLATFTGALPFLLSEHQKGITDYLLIGLPKAYSSAICISSCISVRLKICSVPTSSVCRSSLSLISVFSVILVHYCPILNSLFILSNGIITINIETILLPKSFSFPCHRPGSLYVILNSTDLVHPKRNEGAPCFQLHLATTYSVCVVFSLMSWKWLVEPQLITEVQTEGEEWKLEERLLTNELKPTV